MVWGPASKVYLTKYLFFRNGLWSKSNKEHAVPLFTNLNVLPLNMIYYKLVCNLIYYVVESEILKNTQ